MWCFRCECWGWLSAWFPCCAGCGGRWNTPLADNEQALLDIEAGTGKYDKDKEEGKPDFTPEQRKQAEELCKALSNTLGYDLSHMLAQHLPAVPPPKGEKDLEVERWAELRDARRLCDTNAGKLAKATKEYNKLKKHLADSEAKVE